jgi:tRNA (guanosine-2'-O-)-methyltransferase
LHPSTEAALATLRADGWRFVAAHASSSALDYRDVDYTAKVAVILGAELLGPSEAALAQADVQVAIPMQGLGESVNVSVACAVILFEAQRQRLAAGMYEHSRLSPEQFERTLFEWCYPDIAQRCRRHGLAYPALTGDGDIAENPFLRVGY